MERLSQGEELGVVRRNELTERQDLLIELDASLGEAETEIACVQVAVGEEQLNSIKLRQEFFGRSNLELKDIQTEIAELLEQTKVFDDILARTGIRAPSAGKVQNVSVTTIGSVIRLGEVLMEIVPQDDEILITARISPLDIDNVLPGQETEVRLVAFKSTLTPIMGCESCMVHYILRLDATNAKRIARLSLAGSLGTQLPWRLRRGTKSSQARSKRPDLARARMLRTP